MAAWFSLRHCLRRSRLINSSRLPSRVWDRLMPSSLAWARRSLLMLRCEACDEGRSSAPERARVPACAVHVPRHDASAGHPGRPAPPPRGTYSEVPKASGIPSTAEALATIRGVSMLFCIISADDKYTAETVTWIQIWTPSPFSFRTTCPRDYRLIPQAT